MKLSTVAIYVTGTLIIIGAGFIGVKLAEFRKEPPKITSLNVEIDGMEDKFYLNIKTTGKTTCDVIIDVLEITDVVSDDIVYTPSCKIIDNYNSQITYTAQPSF